MSDGMPTGFVEYAQCGAWHVPVSGVCGFKLEKDAMFVLDASGAALTFDMLGSVLRELGGSKQHRYVSAPSQRQAYLLAGGALKRASFSHETARDGAQWVTKTEYPPDVLLIETDGTHGMIKNLSLRE